MRTLIALLLIGSVWAADREQFTLRDGRVIVGSYDEATQTLVMESPKAALRVDARDIMKREEAPPAPEPVAVKPIAQRPAGMPPLAAQVLAKKRAKIEAQSVMDAAEAAYQTARHAAIRDYFMHDADLTPIVIHVPDNPTAADLQSAKRLTDFNHRLENLRAWRAQAVHVNGEDDPFFSPGAVMEFANARGLQWLLDL